MVMYHDKYFQPKKKDSLGREIRDAIFFTNPMKIKEKKFYCPVCGRSTLHNKIRLPNKKLAWLCVGCKLPSKTSSPYQTMYLDPGLTTARRLAKKVIAKKR